MEKPGSKPIDEMVRLAISGYGPAFSQLWDTHIRSLKAYLRSWIKNLDDYLEDDICSRSFQKAFRQIDTFDPARSQFSTWLRTIAHNTALDVLEQESRSHRQYVYLDDGEESLSSIETIADTKDSALDAIIRDEDEEETEKYIEGLPELYREVARRRLVDGLQYKEIAEELDMELNTVRTRIRRAKALIEKMKEDDAG